MTHHDDQAPRTEISVSALADCSFSMAEEYATEYLRRAEAGGPEATVRVPWPLPFSLLGRRVALSFGIHADVLEAGRRHDEVRFHWESGSRLLPDFRGTMRFRIEYVRTRVHVDGAYAVPLGPVGYCFDRIAGKRIARASLQELADRVAAYLTGCESKWRAASLGADAGAHADAAAENGDGQRHSSGDHADHGPVLDRTVGRIIENQ
jgi:hypothetical protein